MSQHIIFGNYGNETIAVLQWLIEARLKECCIVSIDTGWAANTWQQRVRQAEDHAKRHQVQVMRLQAPANFSDLVKQREEFPNAKYQWCVTLLKGAPLNAWLDQVDPSGKAVIILGKSRFLTSLYSDLPEFIAESEHYGGRKLWYPLYAHDKDARDRLVKASGFSILSHRSLECDPCIHASPKDLQCLTRQGVAKTAELEETIKRTMFSEYGESKPIHELANRDSQSAQTENYHERFARSCASPWVCGE